MTDLTAESKKHFQAMLFNEATQHMAFLLLVGNTVCLFTGWPLSEFYGQPKHELLVEHAPLALSCILNFFAFVSAEKSADQNYETVTELNGRIERLNKLTGITL